MNPENYTNPYSNYPYITHNVRRLTPAAIMRRTLDKSTPDQSHNETALLIAIIDEQFDRMFDTLQLNAH